MLLFGKMSKFKKLDCDRQAYKTILQTKKNNTWTKMELQTLSKLKTRLRQKMGV